MYRKIFLPFLQDILRIEASLQSLRRSVLLLPKRIALHGLLIYIRACVAVSVCPRLHRVEPTARCHADVEHNVKLWLWSCCICFEMGIAGLLVEIIGVGLHGFCGLGKEQFRNDFADAFVGHGNGAWMDVNLDGGMAGKVWRGGKAAGDQV